MTLYTARTDAARHAAARAVSPLEDWRSGAACRGKAAVMDAADPAEAKALCAACPAQEQCRAWAMTLHGVCDPGGVCGGLTEAERASARMSAGHTKRRPAPADPAPPRPGRRTTATSQERRARYAQLRAGGYSVQEAAWELHVAYETACRYETRLKEEGQST